MDLYRDNIVLNYPILYSHHGAICLDTKPHIQNLKPYTKIKAFWFTQDSFMQLIKHFWFSKAFITNICVLSMVLKELTDKLFK